MPLLPEELEVVEHTAAAIGRTGARSLEFGFLDDDPPHRWYAIATFEGTRAICDNQDDPIGAIVGLYAILAAGGSCTTCGRTVAIGHADGQVVGARMRDGRYETLRASDGAVVCGRELGPTGWSSCNVGGAR